MTQPGNTGGELLSGGDEEQSLTNIQTSISPQQDPIRQSADFRSERIFPPFLSLPDDDSIDLDFYTSQDGFRYIPGRHWCFLAEVIGVESFVRLRLNVRDKSGTMVPIAFHTDGRGTEFEDKVQPGHTVTILYALQHGFLDLSTGIRLEDYSAIKVKSLICSSTVVSFSDSYSSTRSSHCLSMNCSG